MSHRSDTISLDRTLHLLLPMRLVPQKRATRAVEAAALLRAEGRDVRVVCFGKGPLVDELTRYAADRDVPLDLPGWTADWVASAPENAITVLPSYREGFGNVLVESAMGGIPSVAVSNSYGAADAMVPTVTGELAFSGDPVDIADAIRRVRGLDAERTARGRSGSRARTAEECCSPRSSALSAAERPCRFRCWRRRSGSSTTWATPCCGAGYLDHLRTLGPLTVWGWATRATTTSAASDFSRATPSYATPGTGAAPCRVVC